MNFFYFRSFQIIHKLGIIYFKIVLRNSFPKILIILLRLNIYSVQRKVAAGKATFLKVKLFKVVRSALITY